MPQVRDRLGELQSKLTDSGKKAEDKKKFAKKGKAEENMETYLKRVEKVDDELKAMKEKITEMRKHQQDVISSPFCDKAQMAKLDALTNEIRVELAKARKCVKDMETEMESNTDTDSALQRIKIQQVTRLTSALAATTNEYYQAQSMYADKMKQRLNRQYNVAHGHSDDTCRISEGEASKMLEGSSSYGIFTQNFMNNVTEAKAALQELEERDKDIKALEKSVSEVNELFQHMGVLVADQGEKIDNIERNVESTTVHIVDANVQLTKANEYRRKSRRKCICIVTIVIVVVIILCLVIVLPLVL